MKQGWPDHLPIYIVCYLRAYNIPKHEVLGIIANCYLMSVNVFIILLKL